MTELDKKTFDLEELPTLPQEDAAIIKKAIPELQVFSTKVLNEFLSACWNLDRTMLGYLLDRMASVPEQKGEN